MNLLPLNKHYIEEAIKKNLEAILIDIPKHKCMVGIPAGTQNTKAIKKYAALSKSTFKEVDYAVWKHRRYRKMSPPMKVGIRNELLRRQGKEDVDIAFYAAKNEFGSVSDKIPARPFLRTTFEEGSEKMRNIEKKASFLLNQCAEQNRGAADFLNEIGLYAADQVKKNITEGSFSPNPPNSPLTVAIKGSSHTLIDTGTMRNAMTAWVTKK
jgi:hypothetical protein